MSDTSDRNPDPEYRPEEDEDYQPGGDPEPDPDPETPGGTASLHHPPAE
ncbi:MAG: hypothetical protein ACFCVK_24690 [Acidimicrobiales bacterium]